MVLSKILVNGTIILNTIILLTIYIGLLEYRFMVFSNVAEAHSYKIVETISIVTKYPIFIGIVQALDFGKVLRKGTSLNIHS